MSPWDFNNRMLEQHINKLAARIAEMEAELLDVNHVCIGNFPDKSSGQKLSVALEEGISELKKQVPKVVTPKNGVCDCGCYCCRYDVELRYCPGCGAKLVWREA